MVVKLRFEDNAIQLQDEVIEAEWKPTWKKVKTALKKSIHLKRIELYQSKEQQSRLFREQELLEYNHWSMQNSNPRKTVSIMGMLEQMINKVVYWRQEL